MLAFDTVFGLGSLFLNQSVHGRITMRSSAGIVAGFLLFGLVANCGGADSGNPNGGSTAGTTANAGEGGGENTGATSNNGGSSVANAGQPSTPTAGEGGMGGMPPMMTGCANDADCGANAKCVDTVCLKDDGQACSGASDCQNNCIDDVCTSKLPDGKDCTTDDDCAHTCIDNVCGPASDVGGDCDVDLGMGGAGGAGAGGASSMDSAGQGGQSSMPQARDCVAPLQCFSGKCLTPNGQACRENVDCIDTCVNSVCQPKSGLDQPCDDTSDCASAGLVCDTASSKCKFVLKQRCTDNEQCQSNRCICADDHCTIRTCKTPTSVCECRWSPEDSESCSTGSAARGAALCVTTGASVLSTMLVLSSDSLRLTTRSAVSASLL